jgi:16S rRNA (uracil1498-N3)-methyltransferase
VALQASEQCRRNAAPEITAPCKTQEIVGLTASTRVLLSETENRARLTDAIQEHPPGGDLLLSVGPEGGWTDAEQDLYRKAGWNIVTLGPTVLRAETAAIAAVAIIMSELQ